jgi:3-methyl-2-oxobutanoate hydroxymethyltransferase
MENRQRRLTVPELMAMKGTGHKISMLTAYDYPTARLLDAAGIEAILVGDSLGMVVQGHSTTLPVTLDQMIYHAEMVGRAVQHALVVVDLPFPSFHLGPHRAIESAARVLKETNCQAVKLEGGVEQAEVIRALVRAGIPVMAHVGLRPQSVHQLGQYAVQRDRESLLADAKAAEQAGAFAMVVECVSASVAEEITRAVHIPTIGIGAGPSCDGQVLVIHDLLGLTPDRVPRHVKVFVDAKAPLTQAIVQYRDAVRNGTFPGPEQTFQ